ncbi:MAG: hypothetical protein EAZ15_08230 [Sphingobacteriales bacterium]|nr:MAG: hypothetical protein EAZ15_08230 [Sphingobacteriales bacterium]
MAIAHGLENFSFDFEVIKPSFKIEQNGLQSINNSSLDYLKLTASIFTTDEEDSKAVEKLLKASYRNENLKIKWYHNLASTFN